MIYGTLNAACDLAQLCVVLEHFTGDVQRQVLRVYQTLDKAEIIRQQILAALHNQNAVCIQLQALFVVLAVIVERCVRRHIQQGIIGDRTLVPDVHMAQRIGIIAALVLIEAVVLLFADLILILMPQRNHAVQRDVFDIVLVLVGILFLAALGHIHTDGEPDIIAVSLYQALDPVLIQEFAVILNQWN